MVIDVSESTFDLDVIERSRELPVVVDFWAVWCGPCRMLGPILEDLANEMDGKFLLARLNVDENQQLASRYGIQGIPAVKAFRDGHVVSEFVGAQPRGMVRQFIDALAPNPLEIRLKEGRALLEAGQPARAETVMRTILAEKPDNLAAQLGLGRALVEQGDALAALEVLDHIPPATPEGTQAAKLKMEISLRGEAAGADEEELRARLERSPGDLESRYRLASALTVSGQYGEALDHLLEIVRRDRMYRGGAARQVMLFIFDLLGEDPLARTYRNRLASVLF